MKTVCVEMGVSKASYGRIAIQYYLAIFSLFAPFLLLVR